MYLSIHIYIYIYIYWLISKSMSIYIYMYIDAVYIFYAKCMLYPVRILPVESFLGTQRFSRLINPNHNK